MTDNQDAKTIFSVGGGKGGVGKSIFAIALGSYFAKRGLRVALVDLDLGASNLHTYLGVIKKTPTIGDFILKRVSSLDEILIKTSQNNLMLISGAEFLPGMANPGYWIKLKIMRHIRLLSADIIIIDLGAGVYFNTLDFFGMSDRGIVVTAPEPGAVMNAYGFIKASLFRRLQAVFKNHEVIGPIIDSESKKTEDEKNLTIDWLSEQITDNAPDMLPVVDELEDCFQPVLVVNKVPDGQQHVLVRNLISLCSDKLGLNIEHAGNLPELPEITNHLLNIPQFLSGRSGASYAESVSKIAYRISSSGPVNIESVKTKMNFSDEEVEQIIQFMEGLDDKVFSGSNRRAWKLRMYFKPSEVVNFLISKGIEHEAFYAE